MNHAPEAEIILVGSELLGPDRIDTNSLYLARTLENVGISVREKHVVGDNAERLARIMNEALSRSRLVIATGGLGPTADDITRETAAELFRLPLRLDRRILSEIEEAFRRIGKKMPAINRRQAMVPEGAQVFSNRAGTAPGLMIEVGKEKAKLVLLPGVPIEIRSMWEPQVLPLLRPLGGGELVERRVLKTTGLPESTVGRRIGTLMDSAVNPAITILATHGQVEIHLRARSRTRRGARILIKPLEEELRDRLGDTVFGVDGETLESVVAKQLKRRRWTLALAESCTGGLLGRRITNVPGSSQFFRGGMIVYSNEAKQDLLGLSENTLAKYGAVSRPVARQMALAVRSLVGAHLGAAITGIAGPGGGTPEKPVGTVHIAISHPERTISRKFLFRGDRERVRGQAAQAALDLIRRETIKK